MFTAAQAAQKKQRPRETIGTKFTAAQAAQKSLEGGDDVQGGFTAAQEAQKVGGILLSTLYEFANG